MITCSKVYPDIPFAHRQPKHRGHCALIHGHNWTFTVTFGCTSLDENGFVVDFGDLKYLKQWLADHLDHACVFAEGDPEKDRILAAFPHLFKPYVMACASAEGVARHVYAAFDALVRKHTGGRAFLVEIRVDEDHKNFVTYRPA